MFRRGLPRDCRYSSFSGKQCVHRGRGIACAVRESRDCFKTITTKDTKDHKGNRFPLFRASTRAPYWFRNVYQNQDSLVRRDPSLRSGFQGRTARDELNNHRAIRSERLSPISQCRKVETRLSRIAPMNAAPQVWTSKPGESAAATLSMMALTTIRKSPRVRKVSGKVRILTTDPNVALTRPMMTA